MRVDWRIPRPGSGKPGRRRVWFSVVTRGVLSRRTTLALAFVQRPVVTLKASGGISRGGEPQHEATRDGRMCGDQPTRLRPACTTRMVGVRGWNASRGSFFGVSFSYFGGNSMRYKLLGFLVVAGVAILPAAEPPLRDAPKPRINLEALINQPRHAKLDSLVHHVDAFDVGRAAGKRGAEAKLLAPHHAERLLVRFKPGRAASAKQALHRTTANARVLKEYRLVPDLG